MTNRPPVRIHPSLAILARSAVRSLVSGSVASCTCAYYVQGRTGGYVVHSDLWVAGPSGARAPCPIISSLSTQTWRRSFPPLQSHCRRIGHTNQLIVSSYCKRSLRELSSVNTFHFESNFPRFLTSDPLSPKWSK